jgi:hypothetical protein
MITELSPGASPATGDVSLTTALDSDGFVRSRVGFVGLVSEGSHDVGEGMNDLPPPTIPFFRLSLKNL